MPALPLDEAGKYVGGAYLVFLALILVYVAIMAAKLRASSASWSSSTRSPSGAGSRAEEEREAVTDERAARARRLAQDRPVAVRERVALPDGRAERFMRELVAEPTITRRW